MSIPAPFAVYPLNALRGGLVYVLGDTAASLILGAFQWQRALGMLVLGATLYATEIPAYFAWIDRVCPKGNFGNTLKRACLAQAAFNPLWIARHLAFIRAFSGGWASLGWPVLVTATKSFMHLLPVGLLMNYTIQNRVPLKWRFLSSASYSAVTAVYFALGEVLFG